MNIRLSECPNIAFFRRNDKFNVSTFLCEDSFNWGNHQDYGGGRSVMLPALRILFTLGIRSVYLLGVDFNMTQDRRYHFEQDRTINAIKNNNATYQKLDNWFRKLRPLFEQHGFQIKNCNPNSGLKAFDFVSFDKAMESIENEFGNIDISTERTEGLYDISIDDKKKVKKTPQRCKPLMLKFFQGIINEIDQMICILK